MLSYRTIDRPKHAQHTRTAGSSCTINSITKTGCASQRPTAGRDLACQVGFGESGLETGKEVEADRELETARSVALQRHSSVSIIGPWKTRDSRRESRTKRKSPSLGSRRNHSSIIKHYLKGYFALDLSLSLSLSTRSLARATTKRPFFFFLQQVSTAFCRHVNAERAQDLLVPLRRALAPELHLRQDRRRQARRRCRKLATEINMALSLSRCPNAELGKDALFPLSRQFE